MDSAPQPSTTGKLAELGNISLPELAKKFADGDAIVVGVVSRVTDGREAPSRLQVMSFSSAI